MPKVFISYRQLDDAQRQRVRSFAARVRDCGIEVILDQFYLDDHPEGPHEKWPKWSSDQALNTEHVIIIGSEAWFLCFDGKQPPGEGLGAACEADDLRTRIYDEANVNGSIRVVLFDDADAKYISAKLKGYHRFHAERDFAGIVKWLGGMIPKSLLSESRSASTSIPNNLPQIPPFFGRVDELQQIADALAPEARTWGACIDGPGGMGKTTLAIRAAQLTPAGQFNRILFLSAKDRELDEDGERRLTGFILSGWLEMLNEIAAQLGKSEITKSAEADRARHILAALAPEKALLILDNLESLTREDRDQLFNFVKRLPPGCKAILTSRRRIGGSGDALILEQLDQSAALQVLADMARHNRLLARTTEPERITLFKETAGRPLLLRWVAGQVGRGQCRTVADAVRFLHSAPKGNDPLEFIFGDLLDDFTPDESKVLVALTYFALPATVRHIAEVGELPEADAESALKTLANRSLVAPDVEEKNYSLLPMVAGFLRKKRPEAIAETGNHLANRAYALIMENGYREHDRFPILEAAWPTVAPAFPVFLARDNERLQTVCDALIHFLEFTGRWDEWLSLNQQAEARAVAARNYDRARWRAYHAGMIHYLRQQSDEVLACAGRAEKHWAESKAGPLELVAAISLRGLGHQLKKDYSAAIAAFREALQLDQTLSTVSLDVAIDLNALANAEKAAGDYAAAERDYREALRVARAVDYAEGVAACTGNLAHLALERKDWPQVEALAREALPLSEKVGRQELIALDCGRLAKALARQGKLKEGLPHARRAVEIYTKLSSPDLEWALEILKECEA